MLTLIALQVALKSGYFQGISARKVLGNLG
jgi:hypothetical protein